ncbi:hypothetical protein MiSe_65910 [Microseira wollei NIES-4236]|uniref:Uncharacterized protein n=1 Tax=Microseira wollei NIES-4236 TaxID=2530354 RepID=A0AAV3XFP7_9CYAN|nr:hypothetical protein MiSe_65910 [Microseira wollei NIES-4236]
MVLFQICRYNLTIKIVLKYFYDPRLFAYIMADLQVFIRSLNIPNKGFN